MTLRALAVGSRSTSRPISGYPPESTLFPRRRPARWWCDAGRRTSEGGTGDGASHCPRMDSPAALGRLARRGMRVARNRGLRDANDQDRRAGGWRGGEGTGRHRPGRRLELHTPEAGERQEATRRPHPLLDRRPHRRDDLPRHHWNERQACSCLRAVTRSAPSLCWTTTRRWPRGTVTRSYMRCPPMPRSTTDRLCRRSSSRSGDKIEGRRGWWPGRRSAGQFPHGSGHRLRESEVRVARRSLLLLEPPDTGVVEAATAAVSPRGVAQSSTHGGSR